MPAYVSHAIMAYDVYQKIDKQNVTLAYMETFSLGGDLARFSKCRRISHKEKMEEFIDNMWEYIKKNQLINNPLYMGVLYGHICHYYMDKVCHPLIRKVDKISTSVGVKSHTLLEGAIDAYLTYHKCKIDIEKFDTRKIFRGKVRKVYKMIDYAYDKTYHTKHVSFSYGITKIMYSKIRWLFFLFGKKLLKKLSRFNQYLETNKDLDIVNSKREIYYKDYMGNPCNDSFMDLYEKSITLAVERIHHLK